jgi:IPT/TIG domain
MYPPIVTGVSPQSGCGGTRVTIYGQFTSDCEVYFEQTRVNASISSSRITATAPSRFGGGFIIILIKNFWGLTRITWRYIDEWPMTIYVGSPAGGQSFEVGQWVAAQWQTAGGPPFSHAVRIFIPGAGWRALNNNLPASARSLNFIAPYLAAQPTTTQIQVAARDCQGRETVGYSQYFTIRPIPKEDKDSFDKTKEALRDKELREM